MLHRRPLLGLLGATLAAPALHAQSFPARPLRLIVPYPPGGVTDILGRIVATPMAERLGQQIVVENRAGAGGNIGVQAAMAAEPDGYTLLLGTAATHGVNPILYPSSGVEPGRDFVPVGSIANMANVLSVNPRRLDVPDLRALIARGKQGGLVYGSVGNGSSSHLCATIFLRMAGFEATHVPYRGSSPAVTALLAAEYDFLFDTTATSTNHVNSGAFRALGVSSIQRASALPNTPTIAEAGVPGYDVPVWNAVFVHARTPAPALARLQQAFSAGMDATTQQKLRQAFVDPLLIPTADLPRWQASEIERWKQMSRDARITLD